MIPTEQAIEFLERQRLIVDDLLNDRITKTKGIQLLCESGKILIENNTK